MIYKKTITFLLLLCLISSAVYAKDAKDIAASDFKNVKLLDPLFEKLYQLEKNQKGKVNIVHIGDSHVQADMFTNVIRQILQTKFGNGGYGFTFPYSLAKTNGTSYIKYASNTEWESRRNIYPVTDVSVGLSGIGLYSNNSDFEINIDVNPLYTFSKIRLLYPTKTSCFRLALPNTDYKSVVEKTPVELPVEKEKVEVRKVNYTMHTVESKETLYRISQKYGISVEKLKDINNLSSNTIRVGMDLKIPNKQEEPEREPKVPIVAKVIKEEPKDDNEPKIILSKEKPYESEFILPMSSNQIVILPGNNQAEYNLSGVVIENDRPGIIYHSIGVNGTKVSDYNKYPLFFEQLPSLSADLIVISLGTNEAFNRWTTPYYSSQMQMFVDKIKKNNPKAIILLMTPPPSLFKRRTPNTFVEGYGDALKQLKGCVVWDLLGKLGGAKAPLENKFAPLMAKDKVHYTREGYEKQGELFSADFLAAYDNYVKSRTN
ncbi:LysM repeat protein [Dysgonomonas alginatilytica]|uniref:LysM repeat protein n=1 Tax=Dysgonomonas alginatilytica TaxID=1605892 RepID=A0A2V3PVS5_9BACT|nr:LysM peptidoglycan-binding domain-containing protein [Dysgonomonas alginatilytica]PXV64070.1 LysM repeat protein [Dysgonomonas alginatilytica]